MPGNQLFSAAGDLQGAYESVDWCSTPLGRAGSWTPTLAAVFETMARTRFPCTLLWGPDAVLLYNNEYVPILGEKHPAALGRRGEDVFPEAWEFISGLLTQIRATGDDGPAGTRTLRWSNAGHPPPAMVTRDGTVSLLERPPEPLLGLDFLGTRHDHSVVIPRGATVVLYTTASPNGEERTSTSASRDCGTPWRAASATTRTASSMSWSAWPVRPSRTTWRSWS